MFVALNSGKLAVQCGNTTRALIRVKAARVSKQVLVCPSLATMGASTLDHAWGQLYWPIGLYKLSKRIPSQVGGGGPSAAFMPHDDNDTVSTMTQISCSHSLHIRFSDGEDTKVNATLYFAEARAILVDLVPNKLFFCCSKTLETSRTRTERHKEGERQTNTGKETETDRQREREREREKKRERAMKY